MAETTCSSCTAPAAANAAGPTPPLNVLLIEDNAGFAYFVRDALRRCAAHDFRIHEARTLAEGRAVLERGGVDVVLLDLGLPDSVRINTFDRLAAYATTTPIIVLTVLDDDELALQAMRRGAQDYLVKDRLDPHLLVCSIRYAVERARADRALRELSARLMDLQDAERRQIARHLHETVAQTLTALNLNLNLLKHRTSGAGPETSQLIADSLALVEQCATEVRTTAYLLHPPLLDEMGLIGAIREFADGFAERSGLRVDLEVPPELERLPREIETTIFRVMQECLTNVHRHSDSPTVSVRLDRTPGEICLSIADRGRGMPGGVQAGSPPIHTGMGVGIPGMRERLRQLGGRLDIHSGPGGTTVIATLPLPGSRP